jgi:hypothetical protein
MVSAVKVKFDFDARKEKPVVILEAENMNEENNLQLLAGFSAATFRVILDEDEDQKVEGDGVRK